MRILIEGYNYKAKDVEHVLHGINVLQHVEGYVCVNYVGYFYNPLINDCVFILPKVMMDEKNQVFAHLAPEAIINMENSEGLSQTETDFIYEFSVWVYRAISVFDKSNDNTIVYRKKVEQLGGYRRFVSNTFLDIIMALINFNKENQNYFTFILKNQHSGYNKINWTQTISHSAPVIFKKAPVYTKVVNKLRQVNFDEELLVIYYSILNYIGKRYGFKVSINVGFELITDTRFEQYMKGLGAQRLRQIKYKYFSDKALAIWEMCMAFFDHVSKIQVTTKQQEYLLAKDFDIVFEAMIDELIGEKNVPNGLQKQHDGKEVDHIYKYQGLIENLDKQTYYIGDSKYYKIGADLGNVPIYKQYTYARNVIQWNLNLFMSDKPKDIEQRKHENKLRDDTTEGYNIIPNFFISAQMDKDLSYQNDAVTKKWDAPKMSRQFDNRIFDRDTLLLFYYDVNFLYILSLYARENIAQKAAWKHKIRKQFREEIQAWLQENFTFYAMKPHPGVVAKDYFESHFREVLGKTYAPYADPNIFSLALENGDKENNDILIAELRNHFVVEKCNLGENPISIIEEAEKKLSATINIKRNGVLMVMMEKYQTKSNGFLPSGKIAVGIKQTVESMQIVKNIKNIGLILFHHRSDEGKHLFAVRGECEVKDKTELEAGLYTNIKSTNLYIVVQMDVAEELDTTMLHPQTAPYTRKTRYDAQYITVEQLTHV